MHSLACDHIPESWSTVGYPSLRSLGSWTQNLLQRVAQIQEWTVDLTVPKSVWLSGQVTWEAKYLKQSIILGPHAVIAEHSNCAARTCALVPCSTSFPLILCRLFNPQSFLTAIKQTTARRNEWPLDRTVLVTEVRSCMQRKAAQHGKAHIALQMRVSKLDWLAACLPSQEACLSHVQVTKKTVDQVDAPSRDGAYVSGLLLEGASW